MADIKDIVARLEKSIRMRDLLADVVFYVTTIDERRSTLDDTLLLIRDKILSLNDGELYSLYEHALEGHRKFVSRYEQILQPNYNAFIKKLTEIWSDSVIESNELYIELKESLKLDASIGIWGPRGWRPTGVEQ